MRVEIYENESVSSGSNNTWEMDVHVKLGHTSNYSDYKTAGHAIDHLVSLYSEERLDVVIYTLANHNKLMGDE